MLNLVENLQKILFLKKVVSVTQRQFKKKTHFQPMALWCLMLLLSKLQRCAQQMFLWISTNRVVISSTFRWISLFKSFLSWRIQTHIRKRLQIGQVFWLLMNQMSTHQNPRRQGEFKVLKRRRTSQLRFEKFRVGKKRTHQTRRNNLKLQAILLLLQRMECKKFQINLDQRRKSSRSWMGSTSRWQLKQVHTPT
jgi:hypothetical protein